MRTVVITGSARGLGLEMAKVFKENNVNVVLNDLDKDNLIKAKEVIQNIKSEAKVEYCICDVTKTNDVIKLIQFSKDTFGKVDIWINNAGVNQPDKAIWELSEDEIDKVIDVDLKGTVKSSKLIIENWIKSDMKGALYNVEGYGSNDAKMLGLSVYGTSKRAITYFTEALAKELDERKIGIIVGKLSPGIMITDFITNALGNKEKINLSESTKKVYNILADYPDVVAKFLVEGMLKNENNNVKIEWLTNRKAAWRFMTSSFNKRNFFE